MSNLKYKHTAYTSAQWASLNPVIVENEIVIESDTKRTKIGNGISTYNELEYADANSVGNSLGSIKPTDAAPTPARNGNYTFSIGGDKPAWLTAEAGVTTVKASDGVSVVYTAPSSYSYTHVDVMSGAEFKTNKTQTITNSETDYPSGKAVTEAIDGVKVVTDARIASLENTLNSANINQETTATVNGVDTVALPKTAADTGMQVQLFGQSVENLVVNGDFRNGTTGWNGYNAILTADDNTLYSTGDGAAANLLVFRDTIPIVYGEKIFIKVKARVTNTLCSRINLSGDCSSIGTCIQLNVINFPLENQQYVLSGIASYTTQEGYVRVRVDANYPDAATGNGKVMEIEECIAINLTQTYGAGNEPTKAQCDLLFANYFEGTDNVLGTGRVRSIGRNLLDSSKDGKSIYTGQADGLTIEQRYVFYDILIGATRNSLIIPNCVNNYSIEGDKVIVNNTQGGHGVTFKFKAIAGKRYYKSAVLSSGIDGVGIGIHDKLGNLLEHGSNSFVDAPENSSFGVLCLTSDTFYTDITYTNVGVFETSLPTTYEPYRESILQLTTPPLRSNGLIKDEIRKGTNGYELVQRINPADGTVLTTPDIIPIYHAGLLNSNSNGTAYFEPIIADAGVYSTNLAVQLTDYPIASFESIRKYANGTYTELNIAEAVIAGDGLSFTHPDLTSGDLVMFTYAYNKESVGRSMTLTHYDSRHVKLDTANGKTYRIVPVVTNGVVTWTAVEI